MIKSQLRVKQTYLQALQQMLNSIKINKLEIYSAKKFSNATIVIPSHLLYVRTSVPYSIPVLFVPSFNFTFWTVIFKFYSIWWLFPLLLLIHTLLFYVTRYIRLFAWSINSYNNNVHVLSVTVYSQREWESFVCLFFRSLFYSFSWSYFSIVRVISPSKELKPRMRHLQKKINNINLEAGHSIFWSIIWVKRR